MSFQNPNPFADGDGELASCAYKYRKWTLNAEEGLDVVGGGVGGGFDSVFWEAGVGGKGSMCVAGLSVYVCTVLLH
jgi:hypothetical protein